MACFFFFKLIITVLLFRHFSYKYTDCPASKRVRYKENNPSHSGELLLVVKASLTLQQQNPVESSGPPRGHRYLVFLCLKEQDTERSCVLQFEAISVRVTYFNCESKTVSHCFPRDSHLDMAAIFNPFCETQQKLLMPVSKKNRKNEILQ